MKIIGKLKNFEHLDKIKDYFKKDIWIIPKYRLQIIVMYNNYVIGYTHVL